MAYVNEGTGAIYRPYPITGSTSSQSTGTSQTSTNTSTSPIDIHAPTAASTALGITTLTDWHKALLWFLGAVLLVALAGPAPNVATMILLIIIVGTLLGNWSKYSAFLGLANMFTGGSSNVQG